MTNLARNRTGIIEENRFRKVLKIYGGFMLAVAILHASWGWFFPGYEEFAGLTEIEWAWISLLNWSLSLFMFSFSFLSFAVSGMKNLSINQLRVFMLSMAIFWSIRLTLEFIYPVRIPFLLIPGPSVFFKVLIAAVILTLLIPEIMLRSGKNSVVAR